MLSIIIPIYNGEKYIVNCLDKLLKQTYKDYEIIIVDDGSIDNSLMLAKSYEEKYRNIHVYAQENSGPGVARKIGFNKSVGEYITFVDVDDYLDENAYEIVINKLKEEQGDIIQFSFSFVNGDKINKVNLGDKEFVGNENCFNFYISQKDLTNTVTTKVYKRELFTNITWPNLFYSEDYALNAQLYGNANKVINISNALYYYVQHQESAIKQPFSERRLDQLAASDLVIEYARSNYP